jgi:1-acyl-sn-glycerol-3-phosphate acyltransferase
MLRSLAFTAVFYINTALFLIFGSPLLFGTRRWAMWGLATHARVSMWLMRVICGTRVEVRGRENLPDGAALIASKHQSAWDTMGIIPFLRDPAMIMKQELMYIPFYGWFSYKFGMIPVRRDKRGTALRQMAKDAADRAAKGRDVVIFAEGTRRSPGAPPAYKPGVAMLYDRLGIPCVPVALNSGVFWPRRSLLRRPGTLVVEFLEPIPPGLPRRKFQTLLEERIETACARLLAETGEAGEEAVAAAAHEKMA